MLTLVTGASGFLGRALVAEFAKTARPDDRVRLLDRVVTPGAEDAVTGDLADPEVLDAALEGVDCVIHLAALPGGASEDDYAASKRINLDASLALIARLADRPSPARLVYASSVAVFGSPLPAAVGDDTLPRPATTYGAHKLMVEIALADLSRLRRIDGVALRLPGLVARPPDGAGLKSAFMSDVFHALASRRPCILPVGAEATVWILSASAAARALLHAARGSGKGALTLPALRVAMSDLVEEIARQARADPALVSYAPDPDLEAQFGRLPPLSTPAADALGFFHDGDVARLVAATLETCR